jgi:O-6-methylguanine DNA methyltransferase
MHGKMQVYYARHKWFGAITVVVEKGAGVRIFFGKRPGAVFNKRLQEWLNAYCNGKGRPFPFKTRLCGTPFQLKVWRAISSIEFGRVKSYGEIARAIGHPKAMRAVGTACGANPLPLFIPCHRVVAKSGLGGFSGGLMVKRRLIKMEAGETCSIFPL